MFNRCTRCLYDELTPGIQFDRHGVCNFCHSHDDLERQYPTGPVGSEKLRLLAAEMKRAGQGNKYDCIIGVSGGCDSSYLLYKMKELGVRPLAVHFDNTWNSTIATENIKNVLKKLDVDLYTVVADNREYDDIYRAFMLSGVPDIEAPTDIALAAVALGAAAKFKIGYICDGHSFRTEGISPLGWLYMDGKYIETIHRQFGRIPMKTYPRMPIWKFLKWMAVDGIKRVRPLYHLDYRKEEAKALLTREFNWKWYGGHHLENRFTAFFHAYFMPRRFGLDFRVLGYSALVRSKQMSREEGLDLLATPPHLDDEIVRLVQKRLGFSEEQFEEVMLAPKRTYREFKTYKQTFERLKPLLWLALKADRIPLSFYMKYTSPDPSDPRAVLDRPALPFYREEVVVSESDGATMPNPLV